MPRLTLSMPTELGRPADRARGDAAGTSARTGGRELAGGVPIGCADPEDFLIARWHACVATGTDE